MTPERRSDGSKNIWLMVGVFATFLVQYGVHMFSFEGRLSRVEAQSESVRKIIESTDISARLASIEANLLRLREDITELKNSGKGDDR